MENKKGYEFFCIDNSFNENEFFNDSKILIIKFDTAMGFPSEILSKIPSSINNLNSANAIFTEDARFNLNPGCMLWESTSSFVRIGTFSYPASSNAFLSNAP